MNFLRFWQEDEKQNPVKSTRVSLNWLGYSVIISLGMLQIVATCVESYASMPQTATIQKLSPPLRADKPPLVRRGAGKVPELAETEDILKVHESVIIPAGNAWAHLMFKYRSARVSPLVQVGPGKTNSEYLFPCETNNGTIGWSLINARGGGCLTMRIKSGEFAMVSRPIGKYAAQDKLSRTDTAKSLTTAQNSFAPMQYYCGAVANSESREWGISVGLPSLETACNEAKQKCSAVSASGECSVVNFGDWNPIETDLIASMVCISSIPGADNEPISLINSKRGSGSTVEAMLGWLQERNRYLRSTACIPSVYSPDDAIVSPTTLKPTLIQTRNVGGNLEIDVLAGSVNIVSAKRPVGLFLEKGSGYRHQTNRLASLDCPSIFQSTSMQDFLAADNWSPDVASELEGYRKDFCQTSKQPRHPSAGIPRFIWNFIKTPQQGNGGDSTTGNIRE